MGKSLGLQSYYWRTNAQYFAAATSKTATSSFSLKSSQALQLVIICFLTSARPSTLFVSPVESSDATLVTCVAKWHVLEIIRNVPLNSNLQSLLSVYKFHRTAAEFFFCAVLNQ